MEKKEGYILEKWEFYFFLKLVFIFLVLKLEYLKGVVFGVLCILGFGRIKEGLVGEFGICDKLIEDYNNFKVSMVLNMVKEGYVVVVVDNVVVGEVFDLECYDKGWNYDYDVVFCFLFELGWSWLGYIFYLDM